MTITLDDSGGRPLRPIAPPTADLTQAERGVGPIHIETHRARTGFEADAELAVPGDWKITVRVRIDDFESATATVTLEIADSDRRPHHGTASSMSSSHPATTPTGIERRPDRMITPWPDRTEAGRLRAGLGSP
ncbi:hypothetical protein BH18ACT3_BH18ACT3_08660 [soil metagenome]